MLCRFCQASSQSVIIECDREKANEILVVLQIRWQLWDTERCCESLGKGGKELGLEVLVTG
jgi:hypothetical protein